MSEQIRPEAAKNLWPSLKRLLGYGRNYRRPMAAAIVMLWLTAIAEVAAPVSLIIWWRKTRLFCP